MSTAQVKSLGRITGKVDLFLADDGVDGLADEHRDVQRAQHADYGKCKQQNDGVGRYGRICKRTRLMVLFLLFILLISQLPPSAKLRVIDLAVHGAVLKERIVCAASDKRAVV